MKVESIKTVGVVGAGTMGQGIVQICAVAGFKTLLCDISNELIAKGITAVQKNLAAAVERGKLSVGQRLEIENNVIPCPVLSNLKAELIIEAVVEELEVKQKLFREIEDINSGKAILATNTSSLSVKEIASVLKDPSRCVGLHFFNPAHQMKLVEVIAGAATEPEWVSLMMEFSRKVGKVPVRVKDSPGFIVNRVARHYYVESLKLLEENVSDVQGIDRLLRSAGFKMGPFELMDLIGIDTNYAVTTSLHRAFYPNPKFTPSQLQQEKIEAGHLGRKTGKGFYDYEKN